MILQLISHWALNVKKKIIFAGFSSCVITEPAEWGSTGKLCLVFTSNSVACTRSFLAALQRWGVKKRNCICWPFCNISVYFLSGTRVVVKPGECEKMVMMSMRPWQRMTSTRLWVQVRWSSLFFFPTLSALSLTAWGTSLVFKLLSEFCCHFSHLWGFSLSHAEADHKSWLLSGFCKRMLPKRKRTSVKSMCTFNTVSMAM